MTLIYIWLGCGLVRYVLWLLIEQNQPRYLVATAITPKKKRPVAQLLLLISMLALGPIGIWLFFEGRKQLKRKF